MPYINIIIPDGLLYVGLILHLWISSALMYFLISWMEFFFPKTNALFSWMEFFFPKTNALFSRIALDQLHEQNSKVIEGISGATSVINRKDE